MVFGGSIILEPVSRDILYETAELRRAVSLKGLVDAIHLATAVQTRCRYFVSKDSDFRKMPLGMDRVLPEKDALARVIGALS